MPNTQTKSQPTRDFDNIWEDHKDPRRIEKKRLIINREKRQENKKKDLGI